ncbi:MAG: aminotransferase class I/II-fold pyridoxal phosphate-dependent enzyme, partial [Pseudomonadota bacterium]|nr:aminotransferase class I/II-fold pyridoxal phosphate-dependent enzyme [Pseudomonadota bacterium]
VIATDDIYEHILWEGSTFCNILNACPELYEQTVVVNGVSKSFAMTGWRIGYAAGPADLIKAMKKVQSQSTSNPCSIAQAAATTALEVGTACVKDMVVAFKRRHDLLVDGLNQIPGFHTLPVDGTFYSYPDVSEAMQRLNIENDVAFAELLLNKLQIAVIPGSAFGTPGYIRLSYATSDANLIEAIERLKTLYIS